MKPLIIAIDFDGTIVEHEYPRIGPQVWGAFEFMKLFRDNFQAKLILWTMRSYTSSNGDSLTPAVEFCRQHGIEFWGINENPDQKATRWSDSNKAYAHMYIDDAAAGTPLVTPKEPGRHPFVDWMTVGPHVAAKLATLRKLEDIDMTAANAELGHRNTAYGFSSAPQVELPKATLVG